MKYHMQHYFKPVSYANKKLKSLSAAMGPSFVVECLSIFHIRYTWMITHLSTKRDIAEDIDDYCQKPGSQVPEYSQICAVVVPNISENRLSSTIFLIESDSTQLISALLRFHKMKAFL